MKKNLLIVILLSLIFAPGCLKKQANNLKNKVSNVFKGKDKNKFKSENLDEFVLEIEGDNDIFDTKSTTQEDKEFSWKEIAPDKEFGKVQFEFDSSEIRPSEKAKIKKNAAQIKKEIKGKDNAKVSVRGHSCKIAKNQEYNYVLSQERAQKVADQYKKEGIPADKIKAVGYGSSLLLTDEDGIEAQSPNRRSETVLIDQENSK